MGRVKKRLLVTVISVIILGSLSAERLMQGKGSYKGMGDLSSLRLS